jgi:N-methylhydantoinase B
VQASINCPVGLIYAGCYCAVRGVAGRELPNAEGYMRPIRIHVPEGTFLNPVLPAACGARGIVGYRVYEAVMGALAQAAPNQAIAAGDGGPSLIMIGGYDNQQPFIMSEAITGAWGARATRDGIEGISNPLANLSNQPAELVEADLPVEVVRYGFVSDSGGAGTFRGGLAFIREYRLLAEEATLTIRSDRCVHRPYGLVGGGPGGAASNTLIKSNGEEEVIPGMPMESYSIRRDDRFRHISAGGGGFGSPLARDTAAVLEDVLEGRVGMEAARSLYGVVVSGLPPEVNHEETVALRADLARTRME